MVTLIRGGVVLAGPDLEVFDPGWIAVADGRIVEVGAGPLPGPADAVLDARGSIVSPAFVNAHTHVADAVAKEAAFGRELADAVMPPDGIKFRALRDTPDAEMRVTMRDTLAEMIACGTSTFADFREGGLAGVRLLREAAAGLPIRAVALGRFAAFPPQPLADLAANRGGLAPSACEEIRATLAVADGFACVSANDLTDQGLADLAAEVRRTGKLLATHVAESPDYRKTSQARTGRGDVERVLAHLRPDFVVHLTDASEAELDRVAAAGVPVVVCPRIQGVMGLGVPRFDRMLERGIPVAIATDNLFLASPDLLREVDYASRVVRAVRKSPRVPSARDMLKAITVTPAKILGRADLGTIAAGFRADLVVFDAESRNLRPVRDPVATIVNRASVRDIRAVLHEGRVVHGRLDG